MDAAGELRTTEYAFLSNRQTVGLVEKVAVILLALCPIIQHYKGLFVNAAVSVLLILFPIVACKLVAKGTIKKKNFGIVFPLYVFFMFQVVDHGTSVTELGQAVVFIVYVTAIASGCLSTRYFVRVITIISIIASVCIIIQYICYYVFHFHLVMVPTTLLLPRSSQWILLAKTGRYSITGKLIKFYRPSAFFLEPSHMFIYMFTPTAIHLFSSKEKKTARVSFLLLAGMVLTTSGMGIATAVMLFFLYLGKMRGFNFRFTLKKLLQPLNILVILFFIAACAAAYIKVPFIRNSVERVITSGRDFSNAVMGRIGSGLRLIKTLNLKQLIIGVQDGMSGVTASMSGFNETLYQYGIIGVILSYIFYVRGLFKLKNEYFWVAAIILVVSLFSQHTHSTMFMIYSTFVFFEGYERQSYKTVFV